MKNIELYEPKYDDLELENVNIGSFPFHNLDVTIEGITYGVEFTGDVVITYYFTDNQWDFKISKIKDISLLFPDSIYVPQFEITMDKIDPEHVPAIIEAIERKYSAWNGEATTEIVEKEFEKQIDKKLADMEEEYELTRAGV